MPDNGVDISEALEKVRQSGEFSDQTVTENTNKMSSMLDNIMDYLSELRKNFMEWLNSLFPSIDIQSNGYGDLIINVIAWVLVVICVIALFVLLYKLLEHYRKTEKDELKAIINLDTGTLDSESWLDLAKNCAQKAEYRDACRAVYMSLIFTLDEKGIIKYDNAKTNLEYLQTVKNKAELYAPLKQVVNIFEYLWYGKHKGSEEDYNSCIGFYDKVVNE